MSLLSDFEKMIGRETSGSIFILRGNTGTGKSSFAFTLLKDFLAQGEPCLFISTQISANDVREKMKRWFGINCFKKEEEKKLQLIDLYSSKGMSAVSDLNELNFHLSVALKDFKPRVLFFDSITSLLLYNDSEIVTKFIQRLVMKLREINATAFFIIDSGGVEEQTVELVSYFLDGILETKVDDSSKPQRLFRVFSVKFGKNSLKWFPFTISDSGFQFTKEAF